MNINIIYEVGSNDYGYKAVFEEYSTYCLKNKGSLKR